MEYLTYLKKWWDENPNVWFGSTESDDIEISNRFEHIDGIKYDLDKLVELYDESIGYIIFQDQISRHIKRAKNLPEIYVREKLDKLIEFVKKFYSINNTVLSGYDFCFVLLPLRHTNQFDLQTFVIKETWNKLIGTEFKSKIDLDLDLDLELGSGTDLGFQVESSNNERLEKIKIYRNYLKASYERAIHKPVYLAPNSDIQIDLNKEIVQFIEIFKDILDTSCHHYTNEDKETENNEHEHEHEHEKNKFKNIFESVKKLQRHFNKTKLILSISGGVDSMVLGYLLKLNKIDFVMTHINYANRGEICEREKELLKYWSKYIGVELYIRDIYEINRPECMRLDLRNLYETYTRNVRFQAYVDTANIKGWDKFTVGLAHNHDDCVENILTNICNKSKYDNLYGMELFSVVEFNRTDYLTNNIEIGPEYESESESESQSQSQSIPIHFTRPFVQISKQEIYDIAHHANIPYLFDSTPKWSQRGMIRDIVRPGLISWNKSSIEGFDELTLTLGESLECVDLLVSNWVDKIKPFDLLDKKDRVIVIKQKMSKSIHISFNTIKILESELKPNKIFWSRLLVKLGFKSSFKNLNEVVSRIKMFKQKFESNQSNLRDLTLVQINKDNKLYFWKCSDQNIIIGFD